MRRYQILFAALVAAVLCIAAVFPKTPYEALTLACPDCIASRGDAGIITVNRIGRNSDIDITEGVTAVWDGVGVYTGHSATSGNLLEIASSSVEDDAGGLGAFTMELFGLDSDYEQIGEIVVLDGLTTVLTSLSYLRLNEMEIRSADSVSGNLGIITANQQTSGIVLSVMPIGFNRAMVAAQTIPVRKNGYMKSWYAGVTGANNAVCIIRWRAVEFGEVAVVIEGLPVAGNITSPFQRIISPPLFFPPKTDILVEAECDKNDSVVVAGFDLLLSNA